MTDIQAILERIKTTMQAEARLSEITTYHLVDGMVPGMKPSVCIGCGKLKYSDYDRDQDEVIAPVRVYVYLKDMQPERGETAIRNLAKEIRLTLLADMYLGGLADESTVTDITFESDQVEQSQLLHFAMIDYDVKFYEPRHRAAADTPTAQLLDATFNSETINMTY